MKVIPHLHDYIWALPRAVQDEIERFSTIRCFKKGESIYHKNDHSTEVFRLKKGAVKMCNYSIEGAEIIIGEFGPGDCFGEMGVIDGLPRISHAVASKDSQVWVVNKPDFETICGKHPEIYPHLCRMLCSRGRLLFSLSEESLGLKLPVRLARILHRLAYSRGKQDKQEKKLYIEISHEELSHMLGSSRQSISKELKSLERSGDIALHYGRIYVQNLSQFDEKYEEAIGMEQITTGYND